MTKIKYNASKTLVSCTLDAISHYNRYTAHEIYLRVLNDYGTVSERQVYRALRKLRDLNKIRAVHEGWTGEWWYEK